MGCEPWPMVGCDAPTASPEVLDAARNAAQAFLDAATGNRLGICERTERYTVRAFTGPDCGPLREAGGACCLIQLAHTPVVSITSVLIDGIEQPPSSYRLVGSGRLARVGGCWPSSDECEPGRVTVTYKSGIPLRAPVIEDGVIVEPGSMYYGLVASAMGEVATEYVAAMCAQPCKLPSRFVNVTRQGVTVSGPSPTEFLRLGITGMPLTDNLVRTVNPNGLRRRPRVVSIDGARRN